MLSSSEILESVYSIPLMHLSPSCFHHPQLNLKKERKKSKQKMKNKFKIHAKKKIMKKRKDENLFFDVI